VEGARSAEAGLAADAPSTALTRGPPPPHVCAGEDASNKKAPRKFRGARGGG